MTTAIRVIDNPTPEKIRVGDYVTLRRIRTNRTGVEVRGTVHHWDPIMADWLSLVGWPNQRFHIDGDGHPWAVARIQREEEVTSPLIPFTTGHATITRGGSQRRVWGIFQAGRFYPIDILDGEPYVASSWTDFTPAPAT